MKVKYEVYESIYNWDEQAEDYYKIGEYNTKEEAEWVRSNTVPEESFSSSVFVEKYLCDNRILIANNDNPNIEKMENLRDLSKIEKDFIKSIQSKYFYADSYDKYSKLTEEFGDIEASGYHDQYFSSYTNQPFNLSKEEAEDLNNDKLTIVYYDLETGSSKTTAKQLILDDQTIKRINDSKEKSKIKKNDEFER